MNRRYVIDLKEGDKLQQVFFCKQKNTPVDRNGNTYLTLVLADRTGSVEALLWDEAEKQSRRFSQSDLIQVVGRAVQFQGRMQLHLTEIHQAEDCPLPLSEFLSSPARSADEAFQELVTLLQSVKDPALCSLAEIMLADEVLMESLRGAPAARSIHHAYPGGLLEHTLSVMQLADTICGHYGPMLNRDFCLIGAFLHDLGKVREMSVTDGIHYTDEGRLLGHVALGLQLLDQKLEDAKEISAEAAMHLRHMLLSHHGKLEHGSPKRPKTMEAFVVHRADELDSALASIKEILDQPGTDGWTAYQPLFDRYLFKGPRPA